MPKRVMILGAGIFQMPLIEQTKAMGLQTIVVSPLGSYPGIPSADIHLALDTTDSKQIVLAAKKYKINAIVTTGTDVSVPTIGAVADALGLVGPSRQTAELVSHKTSFRTFLRKNQLNCPDFSICRTCTDALAFCRGRAKKTVFKPDDSSGSRGVTILSENPSPLEIEKAYQHANQFTRNKLICVEDFLSGREVGGDAFFLNGSLHFVVTTCKHMEGVLVQGHSLPGDLNEKQMSMIKAELSMVAQKLGYANGPMNFDIMVDKNRVTLLEIGLRNGGNGILNCIFHHCGIDLTDWLLNLALGSKIPDFIVKDTKPVSSYVFGSPCRGILKKTNSIAQLSASVPEVIDLVLAKNPGDKVDVFSNNANLIGFMILSCGFAQYPEVVDRIKKVFCLEVESE